jgi:hypothetical protein
MSDLFQLPPPTEREIVSIIVPPNRYEIEFHIEDGERIAVTYGNTTTTYDLTTRQTLCQSIRGTDPPTTPPKFKAARLGPDELGKIHDEVHRIVHGDDEAVPS